MKPLADLASVLIENPLLGRLGLASLELLVLSACLAAALRLARPRSPRLVALLWLIVLAKPVASLCAGAPITVLRFEAPPPAPPSEPRSLAREAPAGELAVLERPELELAPAGVPLGPSATSGDRRRSPWSGIEPEAFVSGLWMLGVAGFLARYLLARRQLRRILAESGPAPDALRQRHAAIARELGLPRVPELRLTEALDSPALLGVVRPVVLLPRRLAERASQPTLEWALRHELAHCKWLDPLAILVRDVARILFHFHPAAWWAGRRHLDALERACDRESLRDPSEARAYARGLYEILLQVRAQRGAPRGVLALARHGRMARRIESLLEGSARPLTPAAAAGAALAGALVLAFGCAVTRSEPPTAGEPAQADVRPLRPGANVFLFGPLSSEAFLRVGEATRQSTLGLHNLWGRPHGTDVYRDLCDEPSNPFDRRSEDLLVLLVTLEDGGQLPREYEELLPAPWSDVRARLERGETYEGIGAARDLRILALAAPARDELESLVERSERLRALLGGSRVGPSRSHGHEPAAGGHSHAATDTHATGHAHGERPPDVFFMGVDVLDGAFWERICALTSRGTWSKTGRPHDEAVYDEIFAPTPNRHDRSDGDLMVLFFCGERLVPMPERYRDLLPRPWEEIEAALRRGETVELTGRARGLELVVLGAPSASGLAALAERTATLARYRPEEPPAPHSGLPRGSRYVVSFDADEPRVAAVRLELPAASGSLALSMSAGARHAGGYEHYLRAVTARDAQGKTLALHGGDGRGYRLALEGRPVTVEYQVALEHDATPWPEGGPDEAPYATADDVFWTGRALFLHADHGGVAVEFRLPRGWRVSTPWDEDPVRPDTFQVADARALTEAFLLAGSHVQARVRSGTAEVLLAVGRGIETQQEGLREVVQQLLDSGRELFGGAPPGRKLLVANRDPLGSSGTLNGGVFGNSISLLSGRAFARDQLAGWAPFVAHEILHLWNGGAGLRSNGHDSWFSEGFTEYHAHVLCARLGLEDRDAFLERLRSACRAYLAHAGSVSLRAAERRELQYDGGFLAALTLDLRLRARRPSSHGLDELMRLMFERHGARERPYSMEDVASLAAELAGDDLERFFARHVAGTEPLPLEADLAAAGLQLATTVESQLPERGYAIHEVLHIRSLTQTEDGLLVRKSAADGYQDGDRLLAIDGQPVRTFGDVQGVVAASKPGRAASLRLRRGESEITLPLVLGGRDDAPLERTVEVRLEAGGSTALLDRILGGSR